MKVESRRAANDSIWGPAIVRDPEFCAWAHRVTLKMKELPEKNAAREMTSVICSEGRPPQAWLDGLAFLLKNSGRGGAAKGSWLH